MERCNCIISCSLFFLDASLYLYFRVCRSVRNFFYADYAIVLKQYWVELTYQAKTSSQNKQLLLPKDASLACWASVCLFLRFSYLFYLLKWPVWRNLAFDWRIKNCSMTSTRRESHPLVLQKIYSYWLFHAWMVWDVWTVRCG